MHVVAVDWSGRLRDARNHIWVAEAVDGRLVDLRSGVSRKEVIARLRWLKTRHRQLAVGLDFAFSFPAWWPRELHLTEAREVWRLALDAGEALLARCEPPFWGRPGKARPRQEHYRATELRISRTFNAMPKSVFQIGGAGAVGTGSVRGMPFLLELQACGFSIWPFDAAAAHTVLEIYPRLLSGAVTKSSRVARQAYLEQRLGDQDPTLLERAAASEDAFDAAVSAIGMTEHADELQALQQTTDAQELLEGVIWWPQRALARRRAAGSPPLPANPPPARL